VIRVVPSVLVVASCGRIGIGPQPDGGDRAPALRRGTCTLFDGTSTVACPIAPPHDDVSHTGLVFQATGDDGTPGGFDVRCQITGTDTITCDRQATTGTAQVAWQTFEQATAIRAQHLPYECDQLLSFTQPILPVDPTRAFVLGSWTQGGSFLNDDDFITLELSTNAVVIRTGSTDSCGISGAGPMEGSLEVLELPGAVVTRGTTGPMASADVALTVTGLPPVAVASTALVFTYRSASNDVPVCELMLRGELTSATELSFSRGMGDEACAGPEIEGVAWQRIDLGALATVQPFTVDLGPDVTTTTVAITAVDPARAVVLSTAQGVSGQGTGEGSASASHLGGELTATMTLQPDAVVVTRAAATASARFTGQVIEWNR
jgi:hypothetical protein